MNEAERASKAAPGESHRDWQLRRMQELTRKPLVVARPWPEICANLPTDWVEGEDDVDEFLASIRRPEEGV